MQPKLTDKPTNLELLDFDWSLPWKFQCIRLRKAARTSLCMRQIVPEPWGVVVELTPPPHSHPRIYCVAF